MAINATGSYIGAQANPAPQAYQFYTPSPASQPMIPMQQMPAEAEPTTASFDSGLSGATPSPRLVNAVMKTRKDNVRALVGGLSPSGIPAAVMRSPNPSGMAGQYGGNYLDSDFGAWNILRATDTGPNSPWIKRQRD